VDKEKLIKWGVPILAHVIAIALASWLALEQPIAEKYGGEIANWVAVGVLLVASIIDSFNGRKKVAGKTTP